MAEAAAQQGAQGLSGMSGAGYSGKSSQHIQNALFNYFGCKKGASNFHRVRLPVKGGRHVLHLVLLPHEMFGRPYAERRDLLDKSFEHRE